MSIVSSETRKRTDRAHTSQQQGVAKLLSDRCLDLRIRRKVDAARRLVQNDDRAPPEQRTRHRNELPLALREVRSTRRHLRVERDDRLAFRLGGRGGDGRNRRLPLVLRQRTCTGRSPRGLTRSVLRGELAVRQHLHTVQYIQALRIRVLAWLVICQYTYRYTRCEADDALKGSRLSRSVPEKSVAS